MAKQTGSHHRLPGSAQVIRSCVAALDDITGARVDWADSEGSTSPGARPRSSAGAHP